MNTIVNVEASMSIFLASDQDLINELNRREAKVRWKREILPPCSNERLKLKRWMNER